MSATLQGIVRDKLGSRWARRLRLGNRIPCCVQGEGKDNLNISIDADEFATARRHHEHLFDIEFDGTDAETAMVRELHWDTLGNGVLHVEFRRVIRGQKTELEVALEFTGHPKGGVLNHLVTHVTISCLPSEIPDSIEVRVDDMDEGHPIFARDLELPEGVELAMSEDTQVAVVVAVRAVEMDEPTAEGEGEEPTAEGDEATPPAGESETSSE